MTQYYRYCVEVTDGGRRIRVTARDADNQTINNEPGGDCRLAEISPDITRLVKRVRSGAASASDLEQLGEALFDALFPAEITANFRSLLASLGGQDALLRLELDLDEAALPQVAALPWEFLRAPQTRGRAVDNLGTHPKVALTRRRALGDPLKPFTLVDPLRIQLVVAAPSDQDPVAYQEVEDALVNLACLHPTQIAPPLATLHNPDKVAIERALEAHEPDIWHFIGHGQLHTARGVEFSELALVRADGRAEWIDDEKVGEMFQVHLPKVVLLQACESGAESSVGALVGVASQVVQRNVPVVIGMQYPISNLAAVAFAEEFYHRLGELKPVDEAVQNSRRLLHDRFKDKRDFAAPVLFMRVKDGQLFVPPKHPKKGAKVRPNPDRGPEPSQPQPFPDRFITDLPHPLAWACAGFNAAESDKERFEALDRLLLNLVKYLAAIALSQYWQDNPDRGKLRQWLAQLSEARLATSLFIVDRVCERYTGEAQKSELYDIFFGPYLRAVTEASPLARTYRELRLRQPDKRARAEDITPQAFLNRLLALRETKWESCPGEADETLRRALLPELRAALEDLLGNIFQALCKYPLYLIEQSTRSGADWIHTLVAFPGIEGEAVIVDPPYTERGVEKSRFAVRALYFCAPDGRPLLNLHPLLIAHLHQLYFLERGVEKGDVWYRRCTSAERYHPLAHLPFLSASRGGAQPAAGEEEDPVAEIQQVNAEQQKADQAGRADEMPLPILLAHLSDDARQACEIGLGEALRIGQFWLGIEFLLMGLSKLDGGPLVDQCATLGIDPGDLRGALRGLVKVRSKEWRQQRDVQALGAEALAGLQVAEPKHLAEQYGTDAMPAAIITPRLLAVLRQAVQWAGEDKVGTDHLLLAILQQHQIPAVNLILGLMVKNGLDPHQFLAELQWQIEAGKQPGKADLPPDRKIDPVPGGRERIPQPPPQKGIVRGKGLLGQMGRDLTALAQAGELHEAIGESAKNAMRKIGQVLLQSQANNPILLGDPGVGKTAIVEGFAWRLAVESGIVPQLAGKRIVDLPPAALLAGTKYRGELEERLQKILAEVCQAQGQTVVFIDEIHTILGGGAEGGLGSIAQALKPALSRGEFPCIGATTVAEYRRYIEKDPALARRFTPVWIEEPSLGEAIEIAGRVAQGHLAKHHGVAYDPDAVEEAVHLSVRYLHEERLPGKAIKLLDQAGPRVVLHSPGALPGGLGISLRGAQGQELPADSKLVTAQIIRAIVAERTGIPVEQLSQSDRTRLLTLETELKQRVMGQDEAVAAVARVIKRARAGLADPRRPLGVFLFAGPTGVGKTELALALAAALFDDEKALLRLDMSEYMEKHTVARLIGSPPGYVGYEDEGQLTSFLRRRPYSVVLFDEMEKAHADVQHLFLQLFDAGRLTDSHGRLADGRNAIFIMTTNLDEPGIQQRFTPEFRNRLDQIIPFKPLTAEMLLMIFDKLFARAAKRFEEQGIQIEIDADFKEAFCAAHTDTTQGARPLERAIADEIVGSLTDKLLAGEIKPGTKVVIGAKVSGKPQAKSPPPPPPKQPPKLDITAPGARPPVADDREAAKARNQAQFEAAWAAMLARLRPLELEIELTAEAKAYLCDPLWNEGRPLDQALTELVEQPLHQKVDAEELQPGDRVCVDKYAADLVFKKLEGDAQ